MFNIEWDLNNNDYTFILHIQTGKKMKLKILKHSHYKGHYMDECMYVYMKMKMSVNKLFL